MERLTAEQLKVIDLSLIEWYYEQAMVRHNDLVRVESLITERGYTLFAIYFWHFNSCNRIYSHAFECK